jgi:hypothetical protein
VWGASLLTWCPAGRVGGGSGSRAQARAPGKWGRCSSSYTGQLMRLQRSNGYRFYTDEHGAATPSAGSCGMCRQQLTVQTTRKPLC